MVTDFWESAVVSIAAAFVAFWLNFLTLPAAVLAALIGGIILLFGGWDWGVVVGASFFVTSLLSKRRDRVEHKDPMSAHARRNLNQVIANGSLIALLAIVYGAGDQQNLSVVAAFLGCVGAVSGDTWATAVARFSSTTPRLITSGERVPAGTPGAVSGIGIVLSGTAGILACVVYFSLSGTLVISLGLAALTGAMVGSLFDSFLGAACQAIYSDPGGNLTDHPYADDGSANQYVRGWRWLSNDLVNFLNSMAGALSANFVWPLAELVTGT